MTSTARQGRDVEHQAQRQLAEAGYWTHRSAGSKSPVDIIAMKPTQTLFVQCKRTGTIGPAEWNALLELARHLGAVPVMARRGTPRKRQLGFYVLTGPKDGSGRQPMIPFCLDFAEVTG